MDGITIKWWNNMLKNMKIKEYLYEDMEGCIVQAICGRIQVPPATESWSLGREVFWKAKMGIRYLTSALATLCKTIPDQPWKLQAGCVKGEGRDMFPLCCLDWEPSHWFDYELIMNYRGPSLALEMACCLHLSAPACMWVDGLHPSPTQLSRAFETYMLSATWSLE